MSRPDSTWKCRCGTLWPACSAQRPHAVFGDPLISMLGRNKFALRQGFRLRENACTAQKRRRRCAAESASRLCSAGRPGHVPTGQHMEMQMRHTLARLLLPKAVFDSLWVPGFYQCSGEINSPCAKVFACAKTLVRRKSAAAAARRNRRAGSAQPGGQVMSRPDST